MAKHLIFVITSIVVIISSALLQACDTETIHSPKPVVEPNNSPAATPPAASPTIPQTSPATPSNLTEKPGVVETPPPPPPPSTTPLTTKSNIAPTSTTPAAQVPVQSNVQAIKKAAYQSLAQQPLQLPAPAPAAVLAKVPAPTPPARTKITIIERENQ